MIHKLASPHQTKQHITKIKTNPHQENPQDHLKPNPHIDQTTTHNQTYHNH